MRRIRWLLDWSTEAIVGFSPSTEERVDALEQRFGEVDDRLDDVDERLSVLEKEHDAETREPS